LSIACFSYVAPIHGGSYYGLADITVSLGA
jgi:hypothetical protein